MTAGVNLGQLVACVWGSSNSGWVSQHFTGSVSVSNFNEKTFPLFPSSFIISFLSPNFSPSLPSFHLFLSPSLPPTQPRFLLLFLSPHPPSLSSFVIPLSLYTFIPTTLSFHLPLPPSLPASFLTISPPSATSTISSANSGIIPLVTSSCCVWEGRGGRWDGRMHDQNYKHVQVYVAMENNCQVQKINFKQTHTHSHITPHTHTASPCTHSTLI